MNRTSPSRSAVPATRLSDEDPALRQALKRCPPATYEAVQQFRRTGDLTYLPVIVRGVIARYVEPPLRPKLHPHSDHLRLHQDLGLDSLTMVEIVILAEEVLTVSINYEELCHLRTVGDVCQFILIKVRNPLSAPPSASLPAHP